MHYRVINRKDDSGNNIKVLLLVSHAIVKKEDTEVRSIFVNNVFLTYYPKEKEREGYALELQDDHRKEAEANGYTVHYDIPLEKRHILDNKPF